MAEAGGASSNLSVGCATSHRGDVREVERDVEAKKAWRREYRAFSLMKP